MNKILAVMLGSTIAPALVIMMLMIIRFVLNKTVSGEASIDIYASGSILFLISLGLLVFVCILTRELIKEKW